MKENKFKLVYNENENFFKFLKKSTISLPKKLIGTHNLL